MKRFAQVNVIPFIDIMLVMLAIVLTTATFIAQERIDLNLPEAKSGQPATPGESLRINVAHDGTLTIDGAAGDLDTLRERLRSAPRDQLIELAVDQAVPFGRFVTLIDLLKGEQRERISIATIRQP
ncbi:MAG TPA: biopolymer transporter ExbD [Gammaproteobacteria bacterium]